MPGTTTATFVAVSRSPYTSMMRPSPEGSRNRTVGSPSAASNAAPTLPANPSSSLAARAQRCRSAPSSPRPTAAATSVASRFGAVRASARSAAGTAALSMALPYFSIFRSLLSRLMIMLVNIAFLHGGQEWDLEVRADPVATAADLLAALAPDAGGDAVLLVDERRVVPRHALVVDAGLREGATVRVLSDRSPVRRDRDQAGVVHLDVVGGLDAGRRHPLPPGTVEVGRSPACAVRIDATTVSRRHARVTVTSAGR